MRLAESSAARQARAQCLPRPISFYRRPRGLPDLGQNQPLAVHSCTGGREAAGAVRARCVLPHRRCALRASIFPAFSMRHRMSGAALRTRLACAANPRVPGRGDRVHLRIDRDAAALPQDVGAAESLLARERQSGSDCPPGATPTLIGTVPPQHMYGFETTVLLALFSGCAFTAERPFYPADICAAIGAAPRPRASGVDADPLAHAAWRRHRIAAARSDPLGHRPPRAGARARGGSEDSSARLVEIYGSTETGSDRDAPHRRFAHLALVAGSAPQRRGRRGVCAWRARRAIHPDVRRRRTHRRR